MKGCLTKSIGALVAIIVLIWLLSHMFPRAYRLLENRVFGIEESDSIKTTVVDTIPLSNDKQWIVKLENENNTHYLEVKVQGVPMRFVLDTGASGMSMSIVEYMFLLHQEKIDSIKDESLYMDASGNTEKCGVIILDSVTVGRKTLRNVQCNIIQSPDAPLLLGQNILSRMGRISIDYKDSILIIEEND